MVSRHPHIDAGAISTSGATDGSSPEDEQRENDAKCCAVRNFTQQEDIVVSHLVRVEVSDVAQGPPHRSAA